MPNNQGQVGETLNGSLNARWSLECSPLSRGSVALGPPRDDMTVESVKFSLGFGTRVPRKCLWKMTDMLRGRGDGGSPRFHWSDI